MYWAAMSGHLFERRSQFGVGDIADRHFEVHAVGEAGMVE